MKFPKSLIVLQPDELIRNKSETGEGTEIIGQANECMKFLSQALGFTYKTYPYSMANHVNASIFISNTFLTENDYFASFYPYSQSEMTFATKTPEAKENTFSFVYPFQPHTWLTIVISVLLCSCIYYYMFSKKVPLVSAFFYTCCSFIGQCHQWKPKWTGQKVLVLTWSFGITVVSLSYKSALLSFLTVPIRDRGLLNFNDLYQALSTGKATITTAIERTYADELTKSPSPDVRLLGETLKKWRKPAGLQYFTDIKKDHAVLHARLGLQPLYGTDLYIIAQDNLETSYQAMYGIENHTKGGFCCKEEVNMAIHRMWAAGLNKKFDTDFAFQFELNVQYRFREYVMEHKIPQKSLNLMSLSGTFYLLIVGLLSAVMCLLCEIFFHKMNKKGQKYQ